MGSRELLLALSGVSMCGLVRLYREVRKTRFQRCTTYIYMDFLTWNKNTLWHFEYSDVKKKKKLTEKRKPYWEAELL